jgi:GH18 family chitinase
MRASLLCAIVTRNNLQMSIHKKTLLRMILTSIVGSLISGISLAQQQYRVVGYYTMWGSAKLPVSAVKFDKLTHVNHAFASPTTSGGITSSPSTIDTALIGATHRAGKKILISLGGANSGSVFSSVAGTVVVRTAFINNLVTYVVTNHYDGADFDWEQPSSSADSINELVLMKGTREAFHQTDPALLLTMAVGSSSYGGRYRNYDSLGQYVDWFNVMTYDMDQGWSGKSGYNAALYYYAGMGSDYSVDQSISYLTRSRRIPSSKLVLGVPFYGKTFNNCSSFNTPFSFSSTPFYYDIASLTGWTRYWDTIAQVPYLSNGSSVITYDDPMSISLKCQYAKTQGMAGIMIWELSQDVVGQSQPLLDAIWNQVLTSVESDRQSQKASAANGMLYDNYPNPFNPSTTIRYQLAENSFASLKVYDLFGRELGTLVNEFKNKGAWLARFDASQLNLSSGVYFYRLEAGGLTQTKRFIFMK